MFFCKKKVLKTFVKTTRRALIGMIIAIVLLAFLLIIFLSLGFSGFIFQSQSTKDVLVSSGNLLRFFIRRQIDTNVLLLKEDPLLDKWNHVVAIIL